jgi:hypothetical protein
MRADMASDANAGEHPFSDRGQNSAMIAEPTRKIKSHAMLHYSSVHNSLLDRSPDVGYQWLMHKAIHRP